MSKFNFKDNWRRDVVYVYLKKVLLYRSFKSLYLCVCHFRFSGMLVAN